MIIALVSGSAIDKESIWVSCIEALRAYLERPAIGLTTSGAQMYAAAVCPRSAAVLLSPQTTVAAFGDDTIYPHPSTLELRSDQVVRRAGEERCAHGCADMIPDTYRTTERTCSTCACNIHMYMRMYMDMHMCM
jgi:hypothetical protein